MEKTMNDIIAFVRKAMDFNYPIETTFSLGIRINDEVSIVLGETAKILRISTKKSFGYFKIENLSESDILKFKLLIEDILEYEKSMALKDLEDFFKEKSKPTNINDLDNDED